MARSRSRTRRAAPQAEAPEAAALAGRRGTRRRLLDAAGEVFAKHGFRAATVREICESAGANVAAIHYHFGDKAGLYSEMLREEHAATLERFPLAPSGGPAATPEERLAAFVSSFLRRIFDPGRPAWFGQLIMREMVEPTPALDALVAGSIRPQFELLRGIVRELLGPQASEEQVRWCASSVVGQCVFYHHCRPVITRLFPDQRYAPRDIERLAEHIARLCVLGLAGLRADAGLRGTQAGRATRRPRGGGRVGAR
jgi:TetR/AcrR family transcriptional regulator, regulator of cefoperazone and chloramphenicol sensitivity